MDVSLRKVVLLVSGASAAQRAAKQNLILCLPVYNAHFFPPEKASKIGMRIILEILCFRLASVINM